MPELSDMFAELAGKLKEHEEKKAQPVNVTYDSEEGYLAHIARVAALQPGQIVTWRDTEGTYRGVFFQFSNTCQPMVICCKDGNSACASLPPLCIVFEE